MFRRSSKSPKTRLFFATDIHGSEQCFRKWLNAAGAYGVDALVLGGDITGKILVPLVSDGNGGWRGELHGQPLVASGQDELAALQKQIRMIGRYDVEMTQEEKQLVDAEPARLDELFMRAMAETLERWVALADERLAAAGIPAYAMLGNDDFPELADILRSSTSLAYAEDEIFELPGGYELLSNGYSTPTPWNTAREIPDEELADRLETQIAGLRDPEWSVFNVHCPPYGTHLDSAPLLDDTLKPISSAAGVQMAPVGSTAVREAIERQGPLLGLHGHVHESAGVEKIGRTVCINPGSDYGDGILRGAIVELDRDRGVRNWQLTQG